MYITQPLTPFFCLKSLVFSTPAAVLLFIRQSLFLTTTFFSLSSRPKLPFLSLLFFDQVILFSKKTPVPVNFCQLESFSASPTFVSPFFATFFT